MARQRIVAGTVAQLSWQAVDQDGEPSDPGLTTVGVVGSDGSVVLAPGTATTVTGTERTVSVPAHAVDQLTVTWSGATASAVVYVDVVGGVFFSTAQLRTRETALVNTSDYTTATIIEGRHITETVFEQRTRTAFVPRFVVLSTDRAGRVTQTGIRSVSWLEMTDGTVTTDAAEIAAAVEITQGGIVCTTSVARLGVIIGFDTCPTDVARAAMAYTRRLITESSATGMDMRSVATVLEDGQEFGNPTPGRPRFITGITEVDEVLRAYMGTKTPRSIRTGLW